jgi:hypothetical protein
MKKILLIFTLFLLSKYSFAGVTGKTLYKCEFTMMNEKKIVGWFEVSGYEKYCYFDQNSQYLNNGGMVEVIENVKKNNQNLMIYKRIFFPKYAQTDTLTGHLKGKFICALSSEVAVININNIKSVNYVSTLKEFDNSWIDVTEVNQELLTLLKTKKNINTTTVGETLQTFTFFNYNQSISKTKLQELADNYLKSLETVYEKSDRNTFNSLIKKLNTKYLQKKIVVVSAKSPC